MSNDSARTFNLLADDPPLLHLWQGEWNRGGFGRASLTALYEFLFPPGRERAVIVETGAGLSTLAFLASRPERLITVSVDRDGGLESRIREWCRKAGLDTEPLEYINDLSEKVLPGISTRGIKADICMIDGGHGWPTVMVDFCYMNMILKRGGHLVVDDLQLFSVNQLALLLRSQPGWSVAREIGMKTVVFRKDTSQAMLPDFGGQPYIMERSGLRPAAPA